MRFLSCCLQMSIFFSGEVGMRPLERERRSSLLKEESSRVPLGVMERRGGGGPLGVMPPLLASPCSGLVATGDWPTEAGCFVGAGR